MCFPNLSFIQLNVQQTELVTDTIPGSSKVKPNRNITLNVHAAIFDCFPPRLAYIYRRTHTPSATTHPPFLCTAWKEAGADLPPAVPEMPVSLELPLQSETGGERKSWKGKGWKRRTATMGTTRSGFQNEIFSFVCSVYHGREHFHSGLQ